MVGTTSGNLGTIMYKLKVLGMRGPRKMKVLIPRHSKDRSTPVFCVGKSLLEKYKQRDTSDLIMLTSKDAEWDKELKSYVLNYHGRATQVKRADRITFMLQSLVVNYKFLPCQYLI